MKKDMVLEFGVLHACVLMTAGKSAIILSVPGDNGCIEVPITDKTAWAFAAQLRLPVNAEPICEPTL